MIEQQKTKLISELIKVEPDFYDSFQLFLLNLNFSRLHIRLELIGQNYKNLRIFLYCLTFTKELKKVGYSKIIILLTSLI